MIITYTDGTSDNLGKIVYNNGDDENVDERLIFSLLDDNTYGVSLNVNYTNIAIDEINIPATYKGLPVTKIMANGFEKSKIKSITIPESVTNIGGYAFNECKDLTSVVFENPDGWKAGGNSLQTSHYENYQNSAGKKVITETYNLSNPSSAAKALSGRVQVLNYRTSDGIGGYTNFYNYYNWYQLNWTCK